MILEKRTVQYAATVQQLYGVFRFVWTRQQNCSLWHVFVYLWGLEMLTYKRPKRAFFNLGAIYPRSHEGHFCGPWHSDFAQSLRLHEYAINKLLVSHSLFKWTSHCKKTARKSDTRALIQSFVLDFHCNWYYLYESKLKYVFRKSINFQCQINFW